VTTFDVRTVKLRPGEQFRDVRRVELAPFELGGEPYFAVPSEPEAAFAMTRVGSGLLFELELEARLVGPCFRCLADARIETPVRAQEYHATSPADSDELRTPYLSDNRLDLSGWARDAVALALPEQILCRSECAGLCAGCGADLNIEACVCGPPEPDSRWAKLAEVRERL
jgi:uncharacterized protein